MTFHGNPATEEPGLLKASLKDAEFRRTIDKDLVIATGIALREHTFAKQTAYGYFENGFDSTVFSFTEDDRLQSITTVMDEISYGVFSDLIPFKLIKGEFEPLTIDELSSLEDIFRSIIKELD